MIFMYDTLAEARAAAKRIHGTYRKADGCWLVMSWAEWKNWKKQK